MKKQMSKEEYLRDEAIDKWLEDAGIYPYKKNVRDKFNSFIIPAFTYKGFPFPTFPFYHEVSDFIFDLIFDIEKNHDITEHVVNKETFGIISKTNGKHNNTSYLFFTKTYTLNDGVMFKEYTRDHFTKGGYFNIYGDAKGYVDP